MPYLDENTFGVTETGGFTDSFDDRPTPQGRNKKSKADLARHAQYGVRTSAVTDGRIAGSTWTKVKPHDFDIPDRHELFLLADGEKKVEMETVTREYNHTQPPRETSANTLHSAEVANAALFTFNKEDHTLANLLRDKLFRLEHVTFSAYKVPHPLFATFELRVHTDGEISPKDAVITACRELINELQELDQEFTKEFELKKLAATGANGGMEI